MVISTRKVVLRFGLVLLVVGGVLGFCGCENIALSRLKAGIENLVSPDDVIITLDGQRMGTSGDYRHIIPFDFDSLSSSVTLNIQNISQEEIAIYGMDISGIDFNIDDNPAPVGGDVLTLPAGADRDIDLSLPGASELGSVSGQIQFYVNGNEQTRHQYSLNREVILSMDRQLIAAGYSHSVAVTHSGKVYSWGNDEYGNLGDNVALEAQPTPVLIHGLSNVASVSTSYDHNLALLENGTVYSWGLDSSGQLGNDSATVEQPQPVLVPGLENVVSVSAGETSSYALLEDGTVMVWGSNLADGLGLGPWAPAQLYPTPVPLDGLSGVVAIAAGMWHSLALLETGEVMAWGYNSDGQLGHGDTSSRDEPVLIEGLESVRGIVAGGMHSLALLDDGSVMAWGSDSYGQVGDNNGSTARQTSPVPVDGLSSGVLSISAGHWHSTAVLSDGSVRGWGSNSAGQLGNGSTSSSQPSLVAVSGLSDAIAVSAGGFHTIALEDSGEVISWGSDGDGSLGDDAAIASQTQPVSVYSADRFVSFSTGGSHNAGISEAGRVLTWGWDFYGQLGDGASLVNQFTPVSLGNLPAFSSVSCGGYHTIGLLTDGTLMSWGWDYYGQLGDDDLLVDHATPVSVSGINGVTSIAAGGRHTLALLESGRVMAWGNDQYGQLGDNSATENQPLPVMVRNLSGVVAIAAGYYHSMALLSNGTVATWGRDNNGQLGDGGVINENRSSPSIVGGLSGVTAIAAGAYHSLALLNDGTIRIWGSDGSGQLGNGTESEDQPAPISLAGLPTVSGITGGWYHTLVLLADGRIMSWGSDSFGQLGDDSSYGSQLTPVEVSGIVNAVAVEAGNFHSGATLANGHVMCWGDDGSGQVGNDNDFANQPVPVSISTGNVLYIF